MKITEIRELSVPLSANISNAVINFDDHSVSLVAVVSDIMRGGKPVIGIAFNSIGRHAQSGQLRDRFIPRLLAAPPQDLLDQSGREFDPARIVSIAMKNEKPGGHGDRASAVGALELAVWDLNAKIRDEPAYVTMARAHGRSMKKRSTDVYAAGGYYYPGNPSSALGEEISRYLDLGFAACKIKIGGLPLAEDMGRIHTALGLLGHGRNLAVDANGRFDRVQGRLYGQEIAPLDLRWYEEIGDPLDYALNAEMTKTYANCIATGENLFSVQDVDNLVRFGGMRPGLDVFQMDAALSYGLTEYALMIETLETAGHQRRQVFPHGGHLINLHIVMALELGGCEAYPGVFNPFGGYPPQCQIAEGKVWPSDAAGFGLEQKPELRPQLEKIAA